MKEVKVGDTIKIDKKYYEHLGELTDRAKTARIAYDEAIERIESAKKNLWCFLHTINPEIVDFLATFNKKDMTLLITRKLNQNEEVTK